MKGYRVEPGGQVDLSEIDPRATAVYDGDKGEAREELLALVRGTYEGVRDDHVTLLAAATPVDRAPEVDPGDTVVVPSMQPHGMRNQSATEPATSSTAYQSSSPVPGTGRPPACR